MTTVYIQKKNLIHLLGISTRYKSKIIDVCLLESSEQFKNYWKYATNICSKEMNILNNYVINYDFYHNMICYRNFFFDGDSLISFEFPDDYPEENIFYFKMKYGWQQFKNPL